MDRNAVAWVAALVVLGLTTGCQRAPAAKAATPESPDVVVAVVEQRTVPIVRDFTARTEAVPTVEIRARVAGVLEQALFKEGSEAKQGQLLFVLQKDEYKAGLESARAQLAKAQADLTRARDASVVDRYKATLDQRKADLGKARQDVARYVPLAEAKAIPQQDLDSSVAAEKVAAAGVEAAAAALRDAELAQRTQVQLAEAAVETAKASIIQAELNLSYTSIHELSQFLGLAHRHDTIGEAVVTAADGTKKAEYWDGFNWTFDSTAAPTSRLIAIPSGPTQSASLATALTAW